MKQFLMMCVLFLSIPYLHAQEEDNFLGVPVETANDYSSDAVQQEINQGDLDAQQANEVIYENDFSSADNEDGGLYCPNGECTLDPLSGSSGW